MSNKLRQNVFISYSAKSDREWIRALADALSKQGVQPWLDESEIGSGAAWKRGLEDALRNSDAIVFALAGDYYERSNVLFELGFAKALGKQSIFIVPGNHDVSWIPADLRDEELVVRKSPDATATALAAALHRRQLIPVEAKSVENLLTNSEIELDNIEFLLNSQPKLPFVLLLDISGSMAGQPIEELNNAVRTFTQTLSQDELASRRVDLAIISFGSEVRVIRDFSQPTMEDSVQLEASGTTNMGEALHTALDMVERRKSTYRDAGVPYFRPWIFLITDGLPTDHWEEAAQRIQQSVRARSLSFFSVAVEGADLEILARIGSSDLPPLRLRDLDFKSLFLWVSSSVNRIVHSEPGETVKLLPPDWAINI